MEPVLPSPRPEFQAIPTRKPGSVITYYDTKTPDLQLRVSATSVKTFGVYRRLKALANLNE